MLERAHSDSDRIRRLTVIIHRVVLLCVCHSKHVCVQRKLEIFIQQVMSTVAEANVATSVAGPPLFSGNNFSEWKYSMEAYLCSTNSWSVVELGEAALVTDITARDLAACGPKSEDEKKLVHAAAVTKASAITERVVGQIILAMSPELRAITRGKKNAKALWEDLCKRFDFTVVDAKTLRARLTAIKLQPGGDIVAHLTKISSVAIQLEALQRPIPDDDLVEAVLDSLPAAEWSIFRCIWQQRAPTDQFFEKLSSALLAEARRLEKDRQKDSTALLTAQVTPWLITDRDRMRGRGGRFRQQPLSLLRQGSRPPAQGLPRHL